MECLFCDLALGKSQTYKIYEDEHTFAFLDIHPLTKGHTIVIPKNHAKNILDLSDNEVAAFFQAIKKIVAHIKEKLRPDGFNIGINMDKMAGQAMDHFHVHVLPRWQGDGGGSVHSIVSSPPQESLEEIQQKIKM